MDQKARHGSPRPLRHSVCKWGSLDEALPSEDSLSPDDVRPRATAASMKVCLRSVNQIGIVEEDQRLLLLGCQSIAGKFAVDW